jgi:hypothetical protein
VTLRRVPSLEDGESARSASENRPLVSLRVQRRPSEVVRTRRRDNGGEGVRSRIVFPRSVDGSPQSTRQLRERVEFLERVARQSACCSSHDDEQKGETEQVLPIQRG